MGFQISCLANVIVHTVLLRYTLTAHTRTYMRIFIRIYMRKKTRIHSHLMCLCYALINVKPEGGEGGPWAYVGHLIVLKNF